MTTRRDILKGGVGLAAILASGKAPAYIIKSMLAARNSIGMRAGGAKLPYDAEVEWLESTGTQYILFDESVDGFDGVLLPENNNSYGAVGIWNGGSRADTIKFTGIQNRGWCVNNGSNSGNVVSYNINYSMSRVVIEGTDISIGDESFTMGAAWTLNFTNTNRFALFGVFKTSDNTVATQSCKIGACKLYFHGELLHDLIPVRVGTEGAMYDRVSKQLFRNQGTGNFSYGADK